MNPVVYVLRWFTRKPNVDAAKAAYERARAHHAPSAHLERDLRQAKCDELARETGHRRVRLVR